MDIENLKKITANKRTIFVSGNFNIVHPGHLRLLRFAKECGDFLVVGVNSDTISSNLIVCEKDRLEGVKSNIWVDYAFILDFDVNDFIKEFKPEVVVKGKEHQGKFNVETEAVNSYGGQILFSSGEASFSSLELLTTPKKEINIVKNEVMHYVKRHNINLNNLLNKFETLHKYKVAVIGETIIDDYISCEALGLSRETPTMVVSPLTKQRFIGGAAIVAKHLANLGVNVDFITLSGCDNNADVISDRAFTDKINYHIIKDISRPTIVKERYRIGNNTVFRISHLRQHEISLKLQNEIISMVEKLSNEWDILVFSDFNYGLLPDRLVNKITEIAQEKNIPIIADSQTSSQQGDISRYKHTKLLTPTEHEARVSLHNNQSGLVVLCEKLRIASKGNNILLKLGSEGMLIHAFNKEDNSWKTDQLLALNNFPVDVAGAGDSVLSCCAISFLMNNNIWETALLGSLAAACQIAKVGNIPLTLDELHQKIRNLI